MKKIHIKKSRQHGFALIDVMVATILLSVGAIAFVKLSNLSIKRIKNNDFRTQATASANTFIEVLRSDPRMLTWLFDTSSQNISVTNPAAPTINCSEGGTILANRPDTWCDAGSDLIRTDALNKLTETFSGNFHNAVGKAVMCLRVEDASTRPFKVSITVVWKLPTIDVATGAPQYTVANADTDCPDFDDAVPLIDAATNPNHNLDSTNPDRGYLRMFTRI